MTVQDALPHSLPERVGQDLFVVYGCVNINRMFRFSRTMTVVRSGGELTLINAVKMNDEGLSALEKLGTVKHVLRLGPFHGMDDAFYVERYRADLWAPPGGTTYTEPQVDHLLAEGGELPVPDAQLFVFKHMTQPEAALLLQGSPGVLVTVDSIQSYSTPPYKPHTNLLARVMSPFMGFPNKTLIGPMWLRMAVTDQNGMKAEFRRLLQFDFDQLICGHGTFVARGAKAEVENAFEKTYGEKPF